MKVKFEAKFARDLKKIKDKKQLSKIKEIINQCKTANHLSEINHLQKLKGYQTFYRIKLDDYRIGIEIIDDEIIFVRFLHRREIYRLFP